MASADNNLQVDRSLDFYGYVVNFSALAAAGTATQTFSIDTDSNFLLTKLVQQSDIAAAAVTTATEVIPLCTVQIQDGGSSRQFFSQAAPVHAIFGTGENPFVLPAPRVLSAGSTITVTLVNYSAATTYNIRLTFMGLKKYLNVGR